MATTMQMGYSDRALLDPAEYLELRRRNPGVIKQTRLICFLRERGVANVRLPGDRSCSLDPE
jgi:hypothetical protein